MIESFQAWNFQTHRKKRIRLDPFVTTIIGRTDKGKSTLVRLLRWVLLNQPTGTRHLTWGTKYSKGLVRIDGHKIVRKKSKKENTYSLNGKKLEAVGAHGVPELISQLVNLDESNFQDQHEAHFWFSKTPGQISKELNRIINLEIIDESLASITKKINSTKSHIQVIEERLEQLQESQKDLEWITQVDEDLQAVETLEFKSILARKNFIRLRSLTANAQSHVKAQGRACAARVALALVLQKAEKALAFSQEVETLSNLTEQATELGAKSCRLRKLITKKELALHKLTKGQRCPICGNMIKT